MSTVNVLITGASGGIGRDLALNLAKKAGPGGAYKLFLVARREEELKAAVDECNEASGAENAFYFVADVTKRAEVDATAAAAVKVLGRVDVWINNAGRGIAKNVLDLTDEDLSDMMVVNVNSALYGMQAAVKLFRAQTPSTGQIINVNSLLGRNATIAPIRSAYSGSKHFLNALTDALRAELKADPATKDIVVTTVSPGPVATDFGFNASGEDSRNHAMAQDVKEVGEVLRRAIETKAVDLYTRDAYKGAIAQYYQNKGE
jgi:short-subunit dehydrogenase